MNRLSIRIIRELRASPLPISTSDLALLCAARLRHGHQRTNNELQRLERMRVVRRWTPIARGEGRPANRWTLASVDKAGAGAEKVA